jgi:hemerythrin-like domain-containing protein
LAALRDADGAPTADALQTLAALADAFVALHRRHLALEDDVAFPRARPLIGVDDERAIGDEMARRRQAGG